MKEIGISAEPTAFDFMLFIVLNTSYCVTSFNENSDDIEDGIVFSFRVCKTRHLCSRSISVGGMEKFWFNASRDALLSVGGSLDLPIPRLRRFFHKGR